MKTIILTGTIGSGKSTASAFLREFGAAVIDSDRVAREAIDPGTQAYHEVIDKFGTDILNSDGTIDRKKLAGIVFDNSARLQQLTRIIHPRVDREVEIILDDLQRQGFKAVFVEMAILVEAPWMRRVQEVWIIRTPLQQAIERLRGRGMNDSEALARLSAQSPPENKALQMGKSVKFISNNGSPEDLKTTMRQLWDKLQ